MEDYASRLKRAMKEKGVTVSVLAQSIGVSYQAVKKVYDGKSACLNAANNAKAAQVLGVSADWLIGNDVTTEPVGQSLETALSVIGGQLQRTPHPDDRQDIASALSNMALRGGVESEQRKVAAIFAASKRRIAA